LVSFPNADGLALGKYSEDAFLKSADTIRDFAKSMITLVSGLFAVYFALLKFIGIESVTTTKIQISSSIVALPPIIFVLTLIAFVIAVLPLQKSVSLSDPNKMKTARTTDLALKYYGVLVGMGLFIAALFVTILVFLGFT
jgi:hypothetical protein